MACIASGPLEVYLVPVQVLVLVLALVLALAPVLVQVPVLGLAQDLEQGPLEGKASLAFDQVGQA